MPFYLEECRDGEPMGRYVTADHCPGFTYADCTSTIENALPIYSGQEAAAMSRRFNERRENLEYRNELKIRYKVIKRVTNEESDSWREREANRFADGTYRKLPWADESWVRHGAQSGRVAGLHFAHMSNQKPGMVAFTESEEKGVADIQKRIRPGKYLSQFYRHYLSDRDIAFWAAKMAIESGNYEFRFASTPDEIQWVYEHGPSSCMAHKLNEYNSPCHPVRVYGAGDLQVCYVQILNSPDDDGGEVDNGEPGSIPARVLCWPEKKTFTRIYGDGGAYENALRDYLKAQGYEQTHRFEGAKLLRIPHREAFVAPYLDCVCRVEDDGENLILDSAGPIMCQYTTGLSADVCTCPMCGDSYDSECGYYIDSRDEMVCGECWENHGVHCEDCGRSTTDEDATHVESVDRHVCNRCLERNYHECDDCGEHFDSSQIQTVEGDTVCDSCYSDNCFMCDECGDHFRDTQLHNASNGESHCGDCHKEPNEDDESEESEDDESDGESDSENPTVAAEDSTLEFAQGDIAAFSPNCDVWPTAADFAEALRNLPRDFMQGTASRGNGIRNDIDLAEFYIGIESSPGYAGAFCYPIRRAMADRLGIHVEHESIARHAPSYDANCWVDSDERIRRAYERRDSLIAEQQTLSDILAQAVDRAMVEAEGLSDIDLEDIDLEEEFERLAQQA